MRNRERSEQGRLAKAVSPALRVSSFLANEPVVRHRLMNTLARKVGTTAPTPAPTSARSTPGSSCARSAPSSSASTANLPQPPLSPNGWRRSLAQNQAQTSTVQAASSRKSGTRACRRAGPSCWARGSRWKRVRRRSASCSRRRRTRRNCRTRSSSSWCVVSLTVLPSLS